MNNDLILVAENLVKDFQGFRAVNDVTIRVKSRGVHALIGPNGAGKTTCFNLITKFIKPTSGKITLRGQDVTASSPASIAELGMVRSFQISAIFETMSVLENLCIALQKKHGETFNFWNSRQRLARMEGEARAYLEEVGLASMEHLRAGDLPYGRKRALELATTLALEPDVLLLDEPLAGMGTEDIQDIANLIRRIADKKAVLMVEHNLSVVADISDVITVLARGAVIASGSYAEVSRDESVVTAYIGSED
ncbi:MAG: ABC transporter ATP-binding protein [Burkholderiaceae bacterium]